LSIHVSDKLKRQIWKGKYVALEKLLPPTSCEEERESKIYLSSRGQVRWQSKPVPQSITDIDTWLTAFTIYMDIVLEKFPLMARQLVHYITIVRRLSNTPGMGWYFYDKEFRMGISKFKSLQ